MDVESSTPGRTSNGNLRAAAIAAAWFYTGGSRPYGYRALGEVSVFVFFGLGAVLGTVYVQTERLSWLALGAAIPVGLLACALLVINNLRDIPTDEASGKRTLAVVLGDRGTRVLYAVCVTSPFVAGTVLYAFCVASYGTLIGAAIPNPAAAIQAVALGGFLLVFLLSGLIFPVENIPPELRWISNLVWGRYYIELVRDALLQGGGWPAMWNRVLAIAIIGGVFYTAAWLTMRRMQVAA